MRVQRVPDGFHDRRNPMEIVMRKFTTLFLLALAMTIGANQAFAQNAAGSNDNGKQDRSEPNDRSEKDDDDGDNDPGSARVRPILITQVRPNKRIWPVVKKETEDCSCRQKVMRVGARFVTVRDCYQSIQVNGRERLRYCAMN